MPCVQTQAAYSHQAQTALAPTPRDQTDAEKAMWRLLRDRQLNGAKFRRQHVVGNFILDFYCHEAKLAIELDGGQHDDPAQKAHDEVRTQALEMEGIQVLRFWNNDVLLNPQGVLSAIAERLRCSDDNSTAID